MVDRLTPERRSHLMSQVKGKNTKPEILVRSLLHKKGFRFRLHRKDLPGSPDIVLPKYRVAIFVHGCFWHGHRNCKKAMVPKQNIDYWRTKISENIKRDKLKNKELKKLGWDVIVIWQCELDSTKRDRLDKKIDSLKNQR